MTVVCRAQRACARLRAAITRWWIERQHPRLSRCFTLRDPRSGRRWSYVLCLDCGQEFEYDLAAMRLSGRRIRRPFQAPDAVAFERDYQDQVETGAALRAEAP